MTPEEMEKAILNLQALTILQASAMTILQAQRRDLLCRAGAAELADRLDQQYRQTLCKTVERHLAKISDDNPKAAAQLRKILSRELDR
jgi:hypothetical protein